MGGVAGCDLQRGQRARPAAALLAAVGGQLQPADLASGFGRNLQARQSTTQLQMQLLEGKAGV